QAQLKPPSALLEKIERHVIADGMSAAVERRFPPKTADLFVSLGENVLQKIVRVLVVRAHVVNETVEARRVFDDQFVKRGGIARLRALHQLLIWIGSWLVHCLALRFNTSLQPGR